MVTDVILYYNMRTLCSIMDEIVERIRRANESSQPAFLKSEALERGRFTFLLWQIIANSGIGNGVFRKKQVQGLLPITFGLAGIVSDVKVND